MSEIVVVGIPARNEAATIEPVVRAADSGLMAAFPGADNVIVLAENGSIDGTVDVFRAVATKARKVVIQSGAAGTGKGTNIIGIIDRALALNADRVVLLDADVRSIEPEWVQRLGAAVKHDGPAMATPIYRRNRFEGNVTNHLVSPLLGAVFGVRIQQPIGGEFAFNRLFMKQVAEWPLPASGRLYGIDIWLTTNALRAGNRLVEVPLGRKIHNQPLPKILWLPQQVLDSFFHVVARLGVVRPASSEMRNRRTVIDTTAERPQSAVIDRVEGAVRRYMTAYETAIYQIFPSAAHLPIAPWGICITADDWPSILADALTAVSDGHFIAARDHLIALYINRVFTFWQEIDGLDGEEIDELLDRVCKRAAALVAQRGIMFHTPEVSARFDTGRWRDYQ